MSNELQTKDEKATTMQQQVSTVGAYLSSDGFKKQLALALPQGGVTADRLARIVFTEIRRTPKLAQCTMESLAGAVMTCAQLGLEPGQMGLAYLIPRNNRQKRVMECNFQLGYKGLVALGWRSTQIKSIQCEAVHENDLFDYSQGIPPRLEHQPTDGDRGDWTHVYAIIQTANDGWLFKVMSKGDILKVRDQYSEAWKHQKAKSPWGTNEVEMAQKTVMIRVMKLAPMSTELAYAIDLDDRSGIGIEQCLDVDTDALGAIEAEASEPEPEAEPEDPSLPPSQRDEPTEAELAEMEKA